jgi:hypothetical protein
VAYLFGKDMIARSIDFILQDESPINLIEQRTKMGYSEYNKPDSKNISAIVSNLIKHSDKAKESVVG